MKRSTSRVTSPIHTKRLSVLAVITLLVCWPLPGPARADAGDLDPTFGNGGKVITDLGGFLDMANTVALLPDGKIVVGGSFTINIFITHFALVRYNHDGSLDTSFGTGGIVLTDLRGNEQIGDIAIQSDGKIVAGGSTVSPAGGSRDFALARYNSNGSLDTGFGTGGVAITHFSGGSGAIADLEIQTDGRIVVAGNVGTITSGGFIASVDFALARYDSNGSLDASFGNGGLVTTDFAGANSQCRAVVIQSDGKIAVAGNTFSIGSSDFALARYNTDGTLDSSFGLGGKITTDFSGGNDNDNEAASSLVIQSDGKLIAAGITGDFSLLDYALARYNANGSLDTSFGTDGKVTTDFFNGSDTLSEIGFEPDGKIVAAGTVRPNIPMPPFDLVRDFALARYDKDGHLDATFGVGGKITTDLFGFADDATSIAIQPDGNIIVVGFGNPASGSPIFDFVLARYIGNSGPTFDTCIQDDSNGNLLRFNSTTGDFRFSNCRKGFELEGRGTVTTRFCKVELRAAGRDYNISALANTCTRAGTASVQLFSPTRVFAIFDRDMSNNTCACR